MIGKLKERFKKSFTNNSTLSMRSTAFTLAEVLITLAIIGIVAALTIPTLVNKVQKHEYVVALKKFYTTQNNGWKELLASDGVESLSDTKAFSYISNGGSCVPYYATTTCSSFFNELHKYFSFSIISGPSSYKTYYLYGPLAYEFTSVNKFMAFPDGSIILDAYFQKPASSGCNKPSIIKSMGGHLFNVNGSQIRVDINGFKKPNTYGRDIFWFYLSDDGILYPYYGRDASLWIWGDVSGIWQNNNRCQNTSGSFGDGCAARIIEEGWEMNY